MGSRLDMSTMLAIHAALRRDLEQVARIHHQVEDDALWPALRAAVAAYPDQLALVEALEQEHAVIDPLLRAVDDAASAGSRSFGDITDELVAKLGGHLAHEEADGLELIDASLSLEDWQRFGRVHGERLLGDAPVYMPWLLDGADPRAVAAFLANVPPALAAAYRGQWASDYAALKPWDAIDGLAPSGASDS